MADDFSPVFDLLLGARDEEFDGEKKFRLFQMLWWVRDVGSVEANLEKAASVYALAQIGRYYLASEEETRVDAFLEAARSQEAQNILNAGPLGEFGIAHVYAFRSNPLNVRDHFAFKGDHDKLTKLTEARLRLKATQGCRYNQDNAIAVCAKLKGPGRTVIKELIASRRDREPFLYAASKAGINKWAFNRNFLDGDRHEEMISPRLMDKVLAERCVDLSWFVAWASMSKAIESAISDVPNTRPRDHIAFGDAWIAWTRRSFRRCRRYRRIK